MSQSPIGSNLYYPPHEGHPELRYKSWAILWCLSRGYSPREIQKLVGPFSPGYVSLVRSRYRALGMQRALSTLGEIEKVWPRAGSPLEATEE